MDKRVASLGVHKKKLKKPDKKKGLLMKVVDYLKSDSYMFAPLVSSQPSDFPPTNTLPTSPTGIETEKSSEENNKRMLEIVGEYLKFDCYMYAPFISPLPSYAYDANTVSPSHTGPVWNLKKVTTSVSTRKITKKNNQPYKHTANVIGEDQPPDNSPLERSTVVRQTLARQETVKHIVHQNCRSSSAPGKRMLKTEPRKLVVE